MEDKMKHESFIEFLASYVKPQVYVELGVYDGSTFDRVRPHVEDWSYGVDLKPRMDDLDGTDFTVYKMSTQEFSKLWNEDIHEDIDLMFIDADHSKEAVLKDVDNFWSYLKDDTGLLLLHDTWPLNKYQTQVGFSGDCYLATLEIKKKYKCELLTIPVPYGLSVIRKVGGDWRNG
jgi:predicted O-methyltransferase YrrM